MVREEVFTPYKHQDHLGHGLTTQRGSSCFASISGEEPVVFSSIVAPPNFTSDFDGILQHSVQSQRESMVSFHVRETENNEALKQKRARRQLLRKQIERRKRMDIIDHEASNMTAGVLEDLAVAVRERQAVLCSEGYQAFVFDNGDVYEGNWKNCRMHGTGCLKRIAANDIYEGEWFLGVRSGTGTFQSVDFDTFYTGRWQDGKRDGRGELVEPEGFFSGEFVDGRIQGYGEYVYNDGHTYRGEWVNGMYEGNGICILPSGLKYEGMWVNGLEHGRGTVVYPNGDTYSGEWRHGQKHGVGTYVSSILQFDGEWRYDTVQGHGECRYADGSSYEGEWLDDMFHGTGTFVGQAQKETYEGEFCRGKRCGTGVYISDELEYRGEWLDDKKHGIGELRTRSGVSLCGSWLYDLPHGEGTFTCNGDKSHVMFDAGKCTRVSSQGPYQLVNVRLPSLEDKSSLRNQE